ncbi:hypothetical protein AB1Y20_021116 [Prymnesium parvum]|uniref:Uncharacterized protein n=1 Tax=Prymnesium parvum TaxID=97485 RepID=A0AB34JL55_PRYPA
MLVVQRPVRGAVKVPPFDHLLLLLQVGQFLVQPSGCAPMRHMLPAMRHMLPAMSCPGHSSQFNYLLHGG